MFQELVKNVKLYWMLRNYDLIKNADGSATLTKKK